MTLHEMDKLKDELASDFPGWRVWYVPSSGRGVMWCAQPGPLINAVDTDTLRSLIRYAHESVSRGPALASIDDYAASAPSILDAEMLRHHSYYEPSD